MSMSDIAWLTTRLPAQEPLQRRSEADYYGASDLIGSALGYATAPRSAASWKHGVSFDKDFAYPELLLTEGNRLTRHLVGNEWQASALRSSGYSRVHAVGVPFLHVPDSGACRVPRSLLVMPVHSLADANSAREEDGYVDQLCSIRARFDVVVACVSATCVRKGEWTGTFARRGIPWVTGADSFDRNALRRMGVLFDTFDFVTSNVLGSHLAYAAHRGCRVSIWGPYAKYRIEDYKNVPWHRKRWHKLGERTQRLSEEYVRAAHPVLFRDPWDAPDLQAWAAPFLGLAFRRELSCMARLLGWSPIGQAEVLLHRATKRVSGLGRGALRRVRAASPS
jgi:hypothetical protein